MEKFRSRPVESRRGGGNGTERARARIRAHDLIIFIQPRCSMAGLNIAAHPPPLHSRSWDYFAWKERQGGGDLLPCLKFVPAIFQLRFCVQFISNEWYYSIPRSRSISRSLKFVINPRQIHPTDGRIFITISNFGETTILPVFPFSLLHPFRNVKFHLYQFFQTLIKTSNNSIGKSIG